MQKSEKKFLAVVVDIQRLARNRLGPFCITTYNSTTYNITFVGTKKPPIGGARWLTLYQLDQLTDLLKVLSAQVARSTWRRLTRRFRPFMSENMTWREVTLFTFAEKVLRCSPCFTRRETNRPLRLSTTFCNFGCFFIIVVFLMFRFMVCDD
jgi:hypothetical protein